MRRLHIVGCPRSGTTVLLQLLATCFENAGSCAHEMSIFQIPETQGDLFISKQPNDIRQLRHIFPRDKELFVIYLGRDPRAVITSRHPGSADRYFCNYRVWRECDIAARHYAGHPSFLLLRYEDLVTAPDRAQDVISAHYPWLRRRRLFSEFHAFARPSAAALQAMHGLQQVNTRSLDKWRKHLPRVAEQYRRHPVLAQDLIRLGYEPDRAWLALLDGIAGIVYPCRYPERRQYLKEWEKALRVYFKSRRYLQQQAN